MYFLYHFIRLTLNLIMTRKRNKPVLTKKTKCDDVFIQHYLKV